MGKKDPPAFIMAICAIGNHSERSSSMATRFSLIIPKRFIRNIASRSVISSISAYVHLRSPDSKAMDFGRNFACRLNSSITPTAEPACCLGIEMDSFNWFCWSTVSKDVFNAGISGSLRYEAKICSKWRLIDSALCWVKRSVLYSKANSSLPFFSMNPKLRSNKDCLLGNSKGSYPKPSTCNKPASSEWFCTTNRISNKGFLDTSLGILRSSTSCSYG